MSGIGKHDFSTDYKSIWKPDLAICPYCGNRECEADFCDVGVGLVQCGPYNCVSCGAIEIGVFDNKLELSDDEIKHGWYKPGRPYGGCGNTVNGELVDHKTAKSMYDKGLLDIKEPK